MDTWIIQRAHTNVEFKKALYTLFNLPVCSVNDVLLVLFSLKTDGILIISLSPKPKEVIMKKRIKLIKKNYSH